MDNVFSWLYFPPVFKERYNPELSRMVDEQIMPVMVKSPEAKFYTLNEINNALNPLKFGNITQIELLKVLDFVEQALDEDFPEQEFYIS